MSTRPHPLRCLPASPSAPAADLSDRSGMMVGTLEGRFLELLVFGMQAKRILEIGTFTGYSSISMAAGMPRDGRIITCELDPMHLEIAERHIEASPYVDRIEIREGPAIETLARLEGPFDFIFIDADKGSYVDYYEAVLPKLAPHGLLAADNTLWGGNSSISTINPAPPSPSAGSTTTSGRTPGSPASSSRSVTG